MTTLSPYHYYLSLWYRRGSRWYEGPESPCPADPEAGQRCINQIAVDAIGMAELGLLVAFVGLTLTLFVTMLAHLWWCRRSRTHRI